MDKQILNNIYNLISDGYFDIAKKRISFYKNDINYNFYEFEVSFLEKYLEECKYYESIKGTEEYEIIEKFLFNGRNQLFFEDSDNAVNYFTAGFYITNFQLFNFMAGRTLIDNYNRQDEAVKYLEEYIDKGGASKLFKAYAILSKYYKKRDKKKSEDYRIKSKKLLSIISYKNIRNDQEVIEKQKEEIKELSSKKDYLKLIELFNESTDEIKIKIIEELYKIGYINQANRLYKENKSKFDKSKNTKKLLYQLDKNKKLFINKGKFYGGSN